MLLKRHLYQEISGLPEDLYTLKAWVQSSGGQKECKVYIRYQGGDEKSCLIAKSSSWTQIKISNISITNGNCQIGIFSDENANNWVKVDDISLFKDSPVEIIDTKTHNLDKMNDNMCLKVICTKELYLPGVYNDYRNRVSIFNPKGQYLSNVNGTYRSISNGNYIILMKKR